MRWHYSGYCMHYNIDKINLTLHFIAHKTEQENIMDIGLESGTGMKRLIKPWTHRLGHTLSFAVLSSRSKLSFLIGQHSALQCKGKSLLLVLVVNWVKLGFNWIGKDVKQLIINTKNSIAILWAMFPWIETMTNLAGCDCWFWLEWVFMTNDANWSR